jgi:hypothetical protein
MLDQLLSQSGKLQPPAALPIKASAQAYQGTTLKNYLLLKQPLCPGLNVL